MCRFRGYDYALGAGGAYRTVKTNGLAVASMVLGILWIYWIGSVLALVFGYVARNQSDGSGGRGVTIA